MKNEIRYLIYRCLNKWNDKSYIGCTDRSLSYAITKHYKKRDSGDKSSLSLALKIYPGCNFAWETIVEGISKENVREELNFWINHFNSRENGYN